MSCRLTPRAREGLREILEYVQERFGMHTANELVDRFRSAFELVARNPGIGHTREDLTDDPEVLFWSVGPSLLAYRVGRDEVEILIIERGDVDWSRLVAE